MKTLQNSTIERPVRLFDVDLVLFGGVNRLAERRTIRVLAETSNGARRICKSRYMRSDIRQVRSAVNGCGTRDLFAD